LEEAYTSQVKGTAEADKFDFYKWGYYWLVRRVDKEELPLYTT
jgi:hypothetical protein